ncbi:MAG: TRAP transporter small permease [Lautropia sp.]
MLATLRTWLGHLEEFVIAALLAVMTIVTFAQVIARYVFNDSFVWAVELVGFLFAWLIFLGMAYGVRTGSHIGVDALVKTFKPATARVVGIVAVIACMAYSAILFVGGWQYVAKMKDIGILAQDLPIEQWIPRAVLPLGFGLLFLRFAQVLYGLWTGERTSLALADEAADALKFKAAEGERS